jgi:hypothetical protein
MSRSIILRLCAFLLLPLASAAHADFAVVLSPPRFELETQAGSTLRDRIDVANASSNPVKLSVRTVDWVYRADRTVEFFDELQAGSCRSWVAIERREITVRPGRPYRFRFEVAPPPGTAPVECRFALMFESESAVGIDSGLKVPISARLAAVVYVGVGGVKPELSVIAPGVQTISGEATPIVMVRNTGQGHGRLKGVLTGSDTSGVSLEFVPGTEPILPGETRAIRLNVSPRGEPERQIAPRLPASARGRFELGQGRTQDVDFRFER